MVLTDAGETLFGIAGSIFGMETQAEGILRDFRQRKRGFIRILSSESCGSYYLPNIIAREELDQAFDILDACLNEVERGKSLRP